MQFDEAQEHFKQAAKMADGAIIEIAYGLMSLTEALERQINSIHDQIAELKRK